MRNILFDGQEKSGSNAEDVSLQPDVEGAQRGIRNFKLWPIESSLDSLTGINQSSPKLSHPISVTAPY